MSFFLFFTLQQPFSFFSYFLVIFHIFYTLTYILCSIFYTFLNFLSIFSKFSWFLGRIYFSIMFSIELLLYFLFFQAVKESQINKKSAYLLFYEREDWSKIIFSLMEVKILIKSIRCAFIFSLLSFYVKRSFYPHIKPCLC